MMRDGGCVPWDGDSQDPLLKVMLCWSYRKQKHGIRMPNQHNQCNQYNRVPACTVHTTTYSTRPVCSLRLISLAIRPAYSRIKAPNKRNYSHGMILRHPWPELSFCHPRTNDNYSFATKCILVREPLTFKDGWDI